MRALISLLLCGSAAWSQSAEEPRALGFVFDNKSGQALTITGTPGAAQLVNKLPNRFVTAAANGRTGLVVGCTAPDAPVVVYSGHASDPAQVKNSRAGADRIVLSADGRAAAAWFGSAGAVQVMTGLPNTPAVVREIALDGSAAVTALAVSDDGGAVAVASAAGVTRFIGKAGAVPLAPAASAIAFVAGSRDLVVVDHNRGAVLLYAEGADTPEVLASTADGIDSPTSAFLSRDRRQLLVGTGAAVLLRHRETGSNTAIAIPAEASAMEPLASDGLYVFRAESGAPVWLLDTTGRAPTIWFVPAAPGDEERK